jgi:uncharacterized protein (TIGR03546 family)
MPDRNQDRISAINSPHELALGVAFGVLIGVMPKDSAIPWLIAMLFLLSRGNLLCGFLAAIAMSIVGPLMDDWSDRMGMALLSIESLQSTYSAWMEVTWVAWTRFNNTVVAGSFAIGVIAWLPVYLLSQVFFRMWGIPLIQQLMQTRFMRLLFGENSNQATSEVGETSLMIDS